MFHAPSFNPNSWILSPNPYKFWDGRLKSIWINLSIKTSEQLDVLRYWFPWVSGSENRKLNVPYSAILNPTMSSLMSLFSPGLPRAAVGMEYLSVSLSRMVSLLTLQVFCVKVKLRLRISLLFAPTGIALEFTPYVLLLAFPRILDRSLLNT